MERIFGGNFPYNFICVRLMVVPQVVDMCKIRSCQLVGTLSIVRLFLQLLLLSIFLYFFGLPAIGKYLKQDVMVVEMKIDTGGIPLPAITISGSAASDIPCFSRNLTTSCIEANTYNLAQNLKDIILGFTRKESISLDRKILSEDFTSFFAGRHYTLNLPLVIGPDDTLDQFFLLLAPGLVRIHLHDPGFYIFNQNPAGPPMERLQFNVKKNMTSIYRMLGMAEMNELNVPSDPCNEDEAYNFNSCVRKSLAMQVQKMNPKVRKSRTGWVPDQVGFRQTT